VKPGAQTIHTPGIHSYPQLPAFPNIPTVPRTEEMQAGKCTSRIPKQVLARCEWGHDDYSLKVENLPRAPPKPGQQEMMLI